MNFYCITLAGGWGVIETCVQSTMDHGKDKTCVQSAMDHGKDLVCHMCQPDIVAEACWTLPLSYPRAFFLLRVWCF